MRGVTEVLLPAVALSSAACLAAGIRARRIERLSAIAGSGSIHPSGLREPFGSRAWLALASGALPSVAVPVTGALVGASIGLRLAGPPGLAVGCVAGFVVRALVRRRGLRRRAQLIERQLAEAVEAAALAVRSGLSIAQALEFAGEEAEAPMEGLLHGLLAEGRVGVPLEEALERFAERVGTDDGRLFVLMLGIHMRSGGNLSGALEQIGSIIRNRVAVRRELRALTAQGRISGTILGSLPIAFFLVLAATAQRDLAPVFRSPAGIAMVGGGLVLEALAYLWIRRLLRVQL
jgi:tight adherence protein B